jgi:magnesium chelatase family protein
MLATISTASLTGLKSYRVEVEVDTAFGLPNFTIVGLGATAIQESRERVRSAIKNSSYAFPTHRITVNLAPAHVRKDGAQFDLPIAIGILAATDSIKRPTKEQLFIGELSLNGRTRPITGLLALLLSTKELGFSEIFIPAYNQDEASLIHIDGVSIYAVHSLMELVDHLAGRKKLTPITCHSIQALPVKPDPDLAAVHGQSQAKRALEIAAAGNHNLLLQGPPGSGKTLLAHCLPGILPSPTPTELLTITKLYSIAHSLPADQKIITQRPFRAPHHTASTAAVIGGGSTARPGDITLAHHGVLFLDELPEFDREVLESLRQPLEERQLTVARAKATTRYPADFIFIGAANPCPCGYYGSKQRECSCSLSQVLAYRKRLSGPLLDRIDLHVTLQGVKTNEITHGAAKESSLVVRQRVEVARKTQLQRQNVSNASLPDNQLKEIIRINTDARQLLARAVDEFALSARSYYRVLRVARTIADLDRSDMIKTHHIAEACQYRPMSPNPS